MLKVRNVDAVVRSKRERLIIVDLHRIQVITSEDRCKVLLIIGCLQYWHSLKRYIFFEYFDGIVGNLILQLNGLNVYVGDGEVVVGQKFVVS